MPYKLAMLLALMSVAFINNAAFGQGSCDNLFSVSQPSRVYNASANKTTYTFIITKLPAARNALSHWGFQGNLCPNTGTTMAAAFSGAVYQSSLNLNSGWTSINGKFGPNPPTASAGCTNGDVVKFDRGMGGETIRYYRVILNGNVFINISSAFVKPGRICCTVSNYRYSACCNLNITGKVSDVTCLGAKNGSIDVTVSQASGIVSYLWNDGVTTEDRTNLAAGTYTVTVTQALPASCSATQTFTVGTTVDVTAPSIVCPVNQTVNNDLGKCGAVVTYTAPVGTDNCSGTITVQTAGLPSGALFPVGVTTNTFTVTDASGNVTSCSFTVTVSDTEVPRIISIPANTIISCASEVPAPNIGAVVATDNCSAVTVTFNDVIIPGSCANRFTVQRTYTVRDGSNNSSSQTQTITVNDETAPVITSIPANTTVSCASEVPVANTGAVVATDNCAGTVTITSADVVTPGSCANRFTIARTYTATDVCGNASSQTQTITVNDETAPSGNAPAAITGINSCIPSLQVAEVAFNAGLAASGYSDNCTGAVTAVLTNTTVSGTNCNWTVTYTFKVLDVCNNELSAQSYTRSGSDRTPPVFTICPPSITIQSGTSIDPKDTGRPTATDNCAGTITATFEDENTDCSDEVYTIRRTWTATDACGNASTCIQLITVNKIQTVDCFSINLLNVRYNGTNTTFTFRACANQCANSLSNIAFVLGSNIPVVSPSDNSNYQGLLSQYNVETPVSRNVFGVKFNVIGNGMKSNECDEFVFTLAGDQRNIGPIKVLFKAGRRTSQVNVHTVVCSSQQTPDNSTNFVSGTESVIEQLPSLELDAMVYPNPSVNKFNVRVQSANYIDGIMLRVFDVNGRIIEEKRNIAAGQTLQIGGMYRPGMYIIEITQKGKRKQLKVIKPR
jgi:hypothetical protein